MIDIVRQGIVQRDYGKQGVNAPTRQNWPEYAISADCADGSRLAGERLPRCDGVTDGVAHDQVGTRSDPIDARLARLAFKGGRTATHALLPGSPALDAAGAGACVTRWDQRGVGRPQGRRCDIGSFERR